MIKLTVVFIVVAIALCGAYPYPAYPAPSYDENAGNGYDNNDYNAKSYGFEPPYPPRFGSGFDQYVYGSYSGHPGPYDTYGNNEGGYKQQQMSDYQMHKSYSAPSYSPY